MDFFLLIKALNFYKNNPARVNKNKPSFVFHPLGFGASLLVSNAVRL